MTRSLLAPLGWLYGTIAGARNAAFDLGILRSSDAGVPVISVGNLTAGGTGKTPLVEHIVRRLSAMGAIPGVVSRGYGRRSKGTVVVSDGRSVLADALAGGDEPLQIALACPGARVVSAGRRSDAARVAVELGAQVLVMDDGFQHRYLRRTFDIVVLDGRRDPFEDRLLPAGMLRERIGGLRRANMVAVSRSESAAVGWRGKLDSVFRGPVIAFVTRGGGLGRLPLSRGGGTGDAQASGPSKPAGPLLAFSGIGDHSVFLDELRRTGVEVTADVRFRDHHWYGGADAGALVGALGRSGASGFVTTSKDAVRLRAVPSVAAALAAAGPVFVLDVAVAITAGGQELDAALEEQVRRWTPREKVR